MARKITGWKVSVGLYDFVCPTMESAEWMADKMLNTFVPNNYEDILDISVEAVIKDETEDKSQEEVEAENNGYSV